MAKITIDMGKHKNGSIIIRGITTKMKPRIKKLMREAGADLSKQIKQHLSTYKRVTPQGRKFPAFQSGGLFRSVNHKLIDNGEGVVVGPNTEYAAINEFGGMTGRGHKTSIIPRPYVWPAWLKLGKKIINNMAKELVRP